MAANSRLSGLSGRRTYRGGFRDTHPTKGPRMRHHLTRTHRITSRPRRLAAVLAVGATMLAGGIATSAGASAAPNDPGVLARIKACESGGSYTAHNPSSSASGAYQFLTGTWRALPAAAGYATAASAPASVQDRAARQLFAQQGTSPWLASASCWRAGAGANLRSSTGSWTASASRSNGSETSAMRGVARSRADTDDHPDRLTRTRSTGRWSERADTSQSGGTAREDRNVSDQRTEQRWHRSTSEGSSSAND